ncbi:hypothetical protein SAMN05444414_104208 [Roseovarius marisflavi]|uniref:Uncharacterized protein n=1 Tax=Roseovarius marisflavi TaxID=1054996 RepID=A0A1M6XN84_9RHOB|nr:hypothetical protein SAMN05444414_104208 [Roseovarius marisflavi]
MSSLFHFIFILNFAPFLVLVTSEQWIPELKSLPQL